MLYGKYIIGYRHFFNEFCYFCIAGNICVYQPFLFLKEWGYNWTLVELKHTRVKQRIITYEGYNWTLVELKHHKLSQQGTL